MNDLEAKEIYHANQVCVTSFWNWRTAVNLLQSTRPSLSQAEAEALIDAAFKEAESSNKTHFERKIAADRWKL